MDDHESHTELRRREQALFARCGVATSERWLELREPSMRARVLEVGHGLPTLHVHGGGGLGALWAPLAGALPSRRHLLVDRPGCGLSDLVPLRGVDLRAHAVSFLASVLDGLEIDRVDIVASSMGGLWSLWLAIDRPERVRSLALIGAPAFTGGTSAPLPLRLLGRAVIGPAMLRMEKPSPSQVRTLWKRMGHDASELDATIHDVMLAAQRVPTYARAWHELLARATTLSGPAADCVLHDRELASVGCPSCVVWGSADPFGDHAAARRIAEALPDATLALAGRGHLPWLDDPSGCAAAVASLWEKAHAEASSRAASV